MTHLVYDEAVPRLPRFGFDVGDGVLGRQHIISVDERVDPGGVGVEHHAGMVVHGGVVGLSAGDEAKAAHQLVLLDGAVANGLGPAAAASQAVVFHVPEAVLGRNVALGQKSVVLVLRADMGNAEVVAVDLDVTLEALDLQHSG